MADEEKTSTCEICKGVMVQELQDYLFDWEGEQLRIEDVPVWVCEQCGNMRLDEEVIEAVEDMLAHMDTVLADEEE